MSDPATLSELKAFEARRAKLGLPPIDRKISRKWTASRLNQVNAIDELLKRKGQPPANHEEPSSGRPRTSDAEMRGRIVALLEAFDDEDWLEAARLANGIHQWCMRRPMYGR